MTDQPTPPPDEQPATAEDHTRAHSELLELTHGWDERAEQFDTRHGGDVQGEESNPWREAIRRYSRNLVAMLSLGVIIVMTALSIFVPMHDSSQASGQHYEQARQKPSMKHYFGTDHRGRDLWQQAWIGGRISLSIGFATALTILIIGVAYGAISGYVGGRLDNAMMRLLDALYGLPYIPFAIITVTLVRDKFPDVQPLLYMVPALSLTTWFTAARIMRGQVLSIKENEYVEAARSMGAKGQRVLTKHVVPNTIGIMVVAIFLEVPNAILGEATLSFLGLGVQPPDTSWGRMAFDGKDYYGVLPHLVWVPAILIAVTVLCAIAIADGMRDALDPRGKRL